MKMTPKLAEAVKYASSISRIHEDIILLRNKQADRVNARRLVVKYLREEYNMTFEQMSRLMGYEKTTIINLYNNTMKKKYAKIKANSNV